MSGLFAVRVSYSSAKSFQPLDDEERDMMDSLEQTIKSGKLPTNELTPKRLAALKGFAKATHKKLRTAISIRLRSTDLTKIKARMARSRFMRLLTAQPTMRLEYKSMTTAKYSHPSLVQIYDISTAHF